MRKFNQCRFGPWSQFWHPNLGILQQAAEKEDTQHRSVNRAVSVMIMTAVLSFNNFHIAMLSGRFLVAEIEIAKSARCRTTRACASCSRYRRKLYHIYLKMSDIRSVSRGGTSSLRSSVIRRPSACGTSSVKRDVKENSESQIRKLTHICSNLLSNVPGQTHYSAERLGTFAEIVGRYVWATRWAHDSCSNDGHTHPNFKQDVEESFEMKIRKLIGMFQCNPKNSVYILLSIVVLSFWQGGRTQPLSTTSLG